MHHRAPAHVRSRSRSQDRRRQARQRKSLFGLTAALAVAAGGGIALPHVLGSSPSTVNVHDAAQRQAVPGGQASGAPGTAAGTASSVNGSASAASATAAMGSVAAAPGTTSSAATSAATAVAAKGQHSDQRKNQAAAPAAPNPACTLAVPAAPTSAAGLAMPYRLTATDPQAGACHETNTDQSAFVEAAIYDPTAHTVSIYHPVVVDGHDQPASPPVPVSLPAGAVVGVWFGYNGDTLTLAGPGAASCVNGLPGSPFGQFAYCNAPAFFTAVNGDPKVTVPPLGTGRDGLPCPTTRDFGVVDQDQSDNLATVYRVVGGRVAQDTAATRGGTALTNGSDEGLLAKAIDPALGCTPPLARDLTDGGALAPSLALNELSAARNQGAPEALVPTSDPMVLVDGKTSSAKTDLYRAGVNMPSVETDAGQSPAQYCSALTTLAPSRLSDDSALLRAGASPTADSPNLLAFLVDRLQGTWQNLNCTPDQKATSELRTLAAAAKR